MVSFHKNTGEGRERGKRLMNLASILTTRIAILTAGLSSSGYIAMLRLRSQSSM